MSTAYNVSTGPRFPNDMHAASHTQKTGSENWIEDTAYSVMDTIEGYAREKPMSVVIWAFGIGFVLGWKLKPW